MLCVHSLKVERKSYVYKLYVKLYVEVMHISYEYHVLVLKNYFSTKL
jgi:hypothetical protein